MGRIESFRELTVWQKSHQLFLDIANDVELFPKKRVAWIIADQILRSSSRKYCKNRQKPRHNA
jgi:hypothetical protein